MPVDLDRLYDEEEAAEDALKAILDFQNAVEYPARKYRSDDF